jgi:hypothetical protein
MEKLNAREYYGAEEGSAEHLRILLHKANNNAQTVLWKLEIQKMQYEQEINRLRRELSQAYHKLSGGEPPSCSCGAPYSFDEEVDP